MTQAIHQASRERRRRMESATEESWKNEVLKNVQNSRTIWELTMLLGGQATIDEKNTNPLWQLEYKRGENDKLIIVATTLPELTEEKIKGIAVGLIGTNGAIEEAVRAAGFNDYPRPYLFGRLQKYLRYIDNKWVEAFPSEPKSENQSAPPCQPTTA